MRLNEITNKYLEKNEYNINGYDVNFGYDDVTISKDGQVLWSKEGDWSDPTTNDLGLAKRMIKRLQVQRGEVEVKRGPWSQKKYDQKVTNKATAEYNKNQYAIYTMAWRIVTAQYDSVRSHYGVDVEWRVQKIDEVVELIKNNPEMMNARVSRYWDFKNGKFGR